jgi:LPXTG-motif cell wall-anchored protein
MNLIIEVVSNNWPILLVFAALILVGVAGLFLWNRRKSKSRSITIRDGATITPQASTSKVVHAVLFDGGVLRELDVPVDLIQTSRPLFPRMMGNKKIILLERIPAETIPLTVSPAQVENKGNGGDGNKSSLNFLEVLGQKTNPPIEEVVPPKQRRKRRKNGKRIKAESS